MSLHTKLKKNVEENHGRLPPIHTQPTKSSKLRAVVEKKNFRLVYSKYQSIFPVVLKKMKTFLGQEVFVENVFLF